MDRRLQRLLAGRHPVTREQVLWPNGMLLDVALHLGAVDLPDDLVTSVRGIVTSGELVLVCEDAHPSTSIWPGGRREAGEAWTQTAVREVGEETGWTVDPPSLRMLGFLHLQHLSPVPPDHPYPHPDFLQVVLHGEGAPGPAGWIDSEGWIVRSYATTREAAASLQLTAAEQHLLSLLAA